MRTLLCLLIIFASTAVHAQRTRQKRIGDFEYRPAEGVISMSPDYCQAPSVAFYEEKFKTTFKTETGERLLKTVVLDPKNYERREEVRERYRGLASARWNDRPEHVNLIKEKFAEINANAGYLEPLKDFPYTGANGILQASDSGNLAVEMENLSLEELEKTLPPKIQEKMGKSVGIEYLWPKDKFDYYLTYDGKRMPMVKVVEIIQEEFEDLCARNRTIRERDQELQNRPTSGTVSSR